MRSLIFHLKALSKQASLIAHPHQKKVVSELNECLRRESMKKLLAYRGKVDLDINLDELRERG
jgi:hypothetical protein